MAAPATLVEFLARAAAAGTGGLRFIDRDETAVFFSWSEVHSRALCARRWFADLGVQPGERVGLVLPTSISFFDALLGALCVGAVPVPLYPPVRLGRLDQYHRQTASMLAAVEARSVITDGRVARLLGETVALTPGCRLYVLDTLPPDDGHGPVAALADDFALVQFSSGTTVDPKPVALTHRALLAQVEALNNHWRHLPAASGVSWLPLYHDMGLIGCVLPAMDVAAELTLIPPELFVAHPALWLRTLSRYRGMISPAPNFAYGLCLEKINDEDLAGVDLSGWRVALNGAEAVSPKVMRGFIERFARWGLRPEALSPVYGLSEASLAVTFSDLDRPFISTTFDARKLTGTGLAELADNGIELVSVGRPLPGFEIQIRSTEGDALDEDRVGRLWVRGPSLMWGYLGRPEATEEAIVDGWLDTGDEGFVHGGELYLTGRAKDVLILRGRNHAPEDVERAIDGLAGVRTGCSAAVSHLEDGAATETLVLLVEARDIERDDRRGQLADRCSQEVLTVTGLAIDRVEILAAGTLPRTSSGKIRRREALRQFLAGTLEPPAKVTWWRLLLAMIRSRSALKRSASE